MTAPRTLYDKIWDDHVVHQAEDGTCLLYIDRHLVHEVTMPMHPAITTPITTPIQRIRPLRHHNPST